MSVSVQIRDVVDVKRYPYVVPYTKGYDTRHGKLILPRGFIYDGATGVPNVCWAADACHDLLYLRPIINGVRLTKSQCDWLYGHVTRVEMGGILCGLIYHTLTLATSAVRPLGLHLVGWPAWNGHRKAESADPENWWRSRIVPLQDRWDFDTATWLTRDAVLKPEYANTPREDFARHNLALI